MKILYIDHYFGSPSMGMEFRPYYFAREWQKAGHEVLCVAASFSHLRSKQPEACTAGSDPAQPARSEAMCGGSDPYVHAIDGLNYLILPTRPYQGNGISRVLNMVEFVWGCFTKARKTILDFKPDLVIASSTYTWDNWVASYYAKKCGAKYVYELHDIWPLSPMELGGMSKWHPFIWLLQRAEDYACRHADKIISVLPAADKHLIERGMRPEQFAYVPNGVLPEEWVCACGSDPAQPAQSEAMCGDIHRAQRAPKEALCVVSDPAAHTFTIGYVGGHAISNALDTLIDAAAKLPEVKLVLVGKGAEKERLMQKACALGSDPTQPARSEAMCGGSDPNARAVFRNIEFRPPVPKAKVPETLRDFDCLYIGWNRSPLYRFGISPNKIYDYMMSGKPIIHAVEAANDPVKEARCGISCVPESVDALVEAIKKMMAMSVAERESMGRLGREYIVKNNLLPDLAKRFLEYVHRV